MSVCFVLKEYFIVLSNEMEHLYRVVYVRLGRLLCEVFAVLLVRFALLQEAHDFIGMPRLKY